MHGDHGIQHYAINSMLYLRTIKDKYIEMYSKFISQLHNICATIHATAINFISTRNGTSTNHRQKH